MWVYFAVAMFGVLVSLLIHGRYRSLIFSKKTRTPEEMKQLPNLLHAGVLAIAIPASVSIVVTFAGGFPQPFLTALFIGLGASIGGTFVGNMLAAILWRGEVEADEIFNQNES